MEDVLYFEDLESNSAIQYKNQYFYIGDSVELTSLRGYKQKCYICGLSEDEIRIQDLECHHERSYKYSELSDIKHVVIEEKEEDD